MMTNTPNQYEGAGTKTVSMFSKLVSQGSSFVMEGVKNLVIKRHVSKFYARGFVKCKICVLCVCVEFASYKDSGSSNGI